MGGFDVVVLQGICASHFDKHVAPLLNGVQQAQEILREQVKELALAVEQKGAHDLTAKLDQLAVDVAQKASIERLDDLINKMDLKASAAEEMSTEATGSFSTSADQFEMWLSEAEQKCREHVSAALAPLEDRQSNTERTVRSHAAKIKEWKSLDSEMDCKANVRDVPTLAQFQSLKSTVERKANSSKVPTFAQFAELQELVESKANVSWVPSSSEFQELRAAVEKKANASSVPCAVDLNRVLEEVQLKANQADVEAALEQKANFDQVTPTSRVDDLASVMERKLAFLAARVQKTSESVDNVLSQAMVCYVPAQNCAPYFPQDTTGQWCRPQVAGDGFAPCAWAEGQARTENTDCSSHGSSHGGS